MMRFRASVSSFKARIQNVPRRMFIPMPTMENSLPPVIASILAANTVVFIAWQGAKSDRELQRFMNRNFALYNKNLNLHNLYTTITCTYSHVSIMHLLSNMVGLFFFGPQVVRAIGPRSFLGLYTCAGFVSSGVSVYEMKYARDSVFFGASGCVNAILALSVLLFPYNRIMIFPVPIPIPTPLFACIWIGQDIMGLYDPHSNVGHIAHLTGAATGAAYFVLRRFILRR